MTTATPLAQPPQMIRTGSGQMVPVSKPFGTVKLKEKRFLVCILHYNGDVEFAEELCNLIADLERTRNHEADIMLVRRADSREISASVKRKLEAKFDKVLMHQCRRLGAKNYPYGPNEMWYDLVMLMGQNAPYRDEYYAFVNLEPDAVVTREGWISELIAAWKEADAQGFFAIGHIHDNPVRHMNGLAVYAADIYRRVGGNILAGGSPQVCYDIRHSPSITPRAKHTPLIHFHYRHSTTTPEEVFAERDGVAPAIFHGVKDRSALQAVRDRHISMKRPAPVVAPAQVAPEATFESAAEPPPPPAPETKRPNAYTYYHKLTGTTQETQAILDLWRKGWATRGWNPVILTFGDAAKHPRYPEFEEAISKLPCATGDRKRWAHQFYRWLALDKAGGGLLTDYDVLPGDVHPIEFDEVNGWSISTWCLRNAEGEMAGAYLAKDSGLREWLDFIVKVDAQPEDTLNGKPHVSDDALAKRHLHMGRKDAKVADVHHFSTATVGTERKSVAMERFLGGK